MHGHAWRPKAASKNYHLVHAWGVSRRSEDSRRIFNPYSLMIFLLLLFIMYASVLRPALQILDFNYV